MPTKTFLNLPKEKRLKILRGAKKEFARVSVDRAVIANIAKESGIPRGSFYQYFFSVSDLYMYLIEYLYEIEKKKFAEYLDEKNNDVFEALKLKFKNQIEKLSKQEHKEFKINNYSFFLNNTLYSTEVLKYIIEKDIQLDENMFPEEIKKSKNFDNVLSLVRGLNNYCVEKFITNSSNASDLIGYYNKNIDYLKCSTLSCISS